jgi:catechol 2,3-dioxygenase-like lactoylglutathione lyase family enzyme
VADQPLSARIHAITLGVDDLERSLRFYRDGLGFPTAGVTGTQFALGEGDPPGDVVMFTLDDGLIFSLYPRSSLALDAGVPAERLAGSGHSIGHFVDSRTEVDRVLALAARAGGTIHGEPHERPWPIYSGYFSDLDGHLWEVLTRLERAAG